jgi:hypothetical protein
MNPSTFSNMDILDTYQKANKLRPPEIAPTAAHAKKPPALLPEAFDQHRRTPVL